jgi:putative transposase
VSFTSSPRKTDSSFELVRHSLLQNEGLPFSDALTAEQIQEAFDAEGVSFGETDDTSIEEGGIVYTMAVTLWAMLSQAVFTDVQRACRAAVQRVAVYYACLGIHVSSTNTGAYCRARAKVTEGVVQRLAEGIAERCELAIPDWWRGYGFRRILLLDGTTISMPDTKKNQAEYPQSSSQAAGVGFPIMRAVAMTSLVTGMVMSFAMGPYSGKETGETALFRSMFGKLRPGDLALFDRYYAGWFMLALVRALQVEYVSVLHQLRTADFSKGKFLSKKDHIVEWSKPQRPTWLDQETYDLLPDRLKVREIEVQVQIPGFRTESLVLVTSLLDHRLHSRQDVADLYRYRWTAELELRDIKSTMKLDVLRRMTPEAVRQELWTGILAYNLVRHSMLQSAIAGDRMPLQLSFAASLQMLANTWVVAVTPAVIGSRTAERLAELRVLNGESHRVGNRPNRVEPRAVKRRRDVIALLTKPRKEAQADLLTGSKSKV